MEQLKRLQQQLNQAIETGEAEGFDFIQRARVISKANELKRHVMQPSDMSMRHSANMMELVTIRTLMELKVLHHIPSTGSIPLADLARVTGAQESLLERMLRLMVGTGFIAQTEDFEYRHTKFSEAYRQSPGPGNWFQFTYDECLISAVNFHEYLTVIRKDLREPDDPRMTAYTARHGQDGKIAWEIMAQFPERMRTFQLGCVYLDEGFPVVGFYDFSTLAAGGSEDGDRVILVDVGGGQGQAIKQILETFPQLEAKRMVLQDLPEPLEFVKQANSLPDNVTIMAHDFWTPQPVKAAKAYYLRRIMHDYSDDSCVKILKHIHDAMADDSKLLISEMVLPSRVDEANLSVITLDNFMLIIGGKERTEENFKTVLAQADLELVKVWRLKEGLGSACLLEARKK